jgi:hypothetical protein
MKRSLIVILPLIGLLIGYLIGQPSQSDNELILNAQEKNLSDQENSLKFDLAKKKLAIFTEKQMNEYHALLDQKEKYKKADDILSKVMLIFLADLGLHLSKKNKDWIKEKRSSNIMKKIDQPKKPSLDQATIKEKEDDLPNEPDLENVVYGYDQEPNEKEEQRIVLNQKARKFRSFFDKLGRNIKNLIPFNHDFNILASNKIYKGKTKPANKELLNFYLGTKSGLLRRGLKSNLKMNYKLRLDAKSGSDPYHVKLRLNAYGDSYTAIQVNDKFTAVHPASHNSNGSGPCRMLILKGKNGLHLYLTFIKRKKKIFGRIVNINRKRPTLGYFLVEKQPPKK